MMSQDDKNLSCDDEQDVFEDCFGESQSELDSKFDSVASQLRALASELDSSTLLYFYSRYKQATEGPCDCARPGGLFNIQSKLKWDAWKALGSMSKDQAKAEYVEKFSEFRPTKNADSSFDSDENVAQTETSSFFVAQISRPMIIVDDTGANAANELVFATKNNDVDLLNEMLAQLEPAQKATVLQNADELGMTLLHHAADRGHLDVLKLLIKNGADKNTRDSDGQTMLHYAASCGHLETVEYLLSLGADKLAKDNEGQTPLALVDQENGNANKEQLIKLLSC